MSVKVAPEIHSVFQLVVSTRLPTLESPPFSIRDLLDPCSTLSLERACVAVDDAAAAFSAATQREAREAGDSARCVGSAQGVAAAAAAAAAALFPVAASVYAADEPRCCAVGVVEAAWASALEGEAKPSPWRLTGSKRTSADVLEFHACMLLATAAVAHQLAALRLCDAPAAADEVHVAAARELRSAAGLWDCLAGRGFDARGLFGRREKDASCKAPPELRVVVCAALRDAALGAAGRLAAAKAVAASPPSLVARLADGAAARERAAHAALAAAPRVDAGLAAAVGLCALGGAAAADAFRAVDARTRDDVGTAIGWARRAAARARLGADAGRAGAPKPRGPPDGDAPLRAQALRAPPAIRKGLVDAAVALQRLVDEFEKENAKVYFLREADLPELLAHIAAPLEIARPTVFVFEVAVYGLRDVEQEAADAADVAGEALAQQLSLRALEHELDALRQRDAAAAATAAARAVDEATAAAAAAVAADEAAAWAADEAATAAVDKAARADEAAARASAATASRAPRVPPPRPPPPPPRPPPPPLRPPQCRAAGQGDQEWVVVDAQASEWDDARRDADTAAAEDEARQFNEDGGGSGFAAPKDAPVKEEFWPCEACTFNNPLDAAACAMCARARPPSAAEARAAEAHVAEARAAEACAAEATAAEAFAREARAAADAELAAALLADDAHERRRAVEWDARRAAECARRLDADDAAEAARLDAESLALAQRLADLSDDAPSRA
ncbi:hypothetical protein M885DRAFT_521480 [Pelagophyceae sp. CCMP2097]|nr:hypothetical protein M885DRAFT_521480 [Pelagophyceae sp. CCMP2097]